MITKFSVVVIYHQMKNKIQGKLVGRTSSTKQQIISPLARENNRHLLIYDY